MNEITINVPIDKIVYSQDRIEYQPDASIDDFLANRTPEPLYFLGKVDYDPITIQVTEGEVDIEEWMNQVLSKKGYKKDVIVTTIEQKKYRLIGAWPTEIDKITNEANLVFDTVENL
jgi:hypothetical protein